MSRVARKLASTVGCALGLHSKCAGEWTSPRPPYSGRCECGCHNKSERGAAMSERPTPVDIIDPDHDGDGQHLLDLIAAHGYVIVHPDDVPVMTKADTLYLDSPYGAGWNACRDRIFGGGT